MNAFPICPYPPVIVSTFVMFFESICNLTSFNMKDSFELSLFDLLISVFSLLWKQFLIITKLNQFKWNTYLLIFITSVFIVDNIFIIIISFKYFIIIKLFGIKFIFPIIQFYSFIINKYKSISNFNTIIIIINVFFNNISFYRLNQSAHFII